MNARIQYARKPWDRGEPLCRIVPVPSAYTDEATAMKWVARYELKAGEKFRGFTKLAPIKPSYQGTRHP